MWAGTTGAVLIKATSNAASASVIRPSDWIDQVRLHRTFLRAGDLGELQQLQPAVRGVDFTISQSQPFNTCDCSFRIRDFYRSGTRLASMLSFILDAMGLG